MFTRNVIRLGKGRKGQIFTSIPKNIYGTSRLRIRATEAQNSASIKLIRKDE